ncbi:hypothetical protein ABIC28_002995 [Rhodococcus sp. PvR044]|uniref:hypothetical protein n=1 Tax=Rhodococcus sp. PvR044 TaxID=3156402 RepID=UPI003391F51C
MANGTAEAFARFEYRIFLRLPLQLIEGGMARYRDEQSVLRLAYEQALIDLDRAAASLLHDDTAAERAHDLRERTAPIRVAVALKQRRAKQQVESDAEDDLTLLRQRRETLLRKHRAHITAPPEPPNP